MEESAYSFYDGMTPHDLRLLLKDLLTRGADVSICCIDGADELGLKS